MAVYTIPTIPSRLQKFKVTINGLDYGMRLLWNKASSCWVIDIYTDGGDPLLMGMPLITGIDLLLQFEYLGIGKNDETVTLTQLIVMTYAVGVSPDTVPTWENLGTDGFLYAMVIDDAG
jgi:hypothetical protein